MPEYITPGVYVEQIGTRGRPIEGVSKNIASFLGHTERCLMVSCMSCEQGVNGRCYPRTMALVLHVIEGSSSQVIYNENNNMFILVEHQNKITI